MLALLERALAVARQLGARHWRKVLNVRLRLRWNEEIFHLLLAGSVGILGGLVNLIFYHAIEGVKHFALHRPGDVMEVAELLDWWQRLLIPALGGLAAGLVLHWGLQLVKPGATNMLEVVVAGDGRLKFRPGLVRTLSSLVSIGTGASIGREGSIVHMAATLASKLGQWFNWHPYRLRLLVGCGAAAGLSAAYNAPIAGAVFAAQIVLGNFSMTCFAPLIVASVMATLVSRSFFGIAPWYEVPAHEFTSLDQLGWFMLFGVLCGVFGAGFLRLLTASEGLFARLRGPVYLRLALGGVIVGAIAIGFPDVWGNGYGATNKILHHSLGWEFLAGLLLAKLVATLAAVGAGTIGGVLTPTLFLGAGLGSLLASGLHSAGIATTLPTHTFALVGMGSVLAATTHSPLLAMIMMFEISLNYSMMPPLMLTCAVATLVARQLHPDSVYTATLKARGLEAGADSPRLGAAHQQKVGDLMRAPVSPMRENTPLPEISAFFLQHTFNFLPVVDAEQRLLGLVALQDLKAYLNDVDLLSSVIASDVMRPAPVVLTPDQLLTDALPMLLASEQRNVPVVNSLSERRLVGSVLRTEALGLMAEAIAARSTWASH
ncbi:MAG: voltage-gated chloride channel ClcB [Proteobacteria bacterium]|nr:voltage-gated chloride channel ClcB [Pseudomonadota bacterium]